MDADAMYDFQILDSLHRFTQVDVLHFIKPSRLAGVSCDQCESKAVRHVMRLGGAVVRFDSAAASQRKKQR